LAPPIIFMWRPLCWWRQLLGRIRSSSFSIVVLIFTFVFVLCVRFLIKLESTLRAHILSPTQSATDPLNFDLAYDQNDALLYLR